MKTLTRLHSLLFSAAVLLLVSGCATTPSQTATTDKVYVEFIAPENFTDVKDGFTPTAKGQAANIEEIRRYLVVTAERYVPEGYRLSIAVTDIDLAGDYEFWGRAGRENIRLVKSIYPPRIELSFSLINSSGAVVQEGQRHLYDLNFQMRLDNRQNDPLRYEKSLIDEWLRGEFRTLRQTASAH